MIKINNNYFNKWYFWAVIIALIFLFIFVSNIGYQSKKEVNLIITPGEGTRQIAKKMMEDKIISSDFYFLAYIFLKRWTLQDGVYRIPQKSNMFSVAKILRSGETETVKITIPEGWRISQIDELLAKNKLIQKGELIKNTKNDEGYLFPDTYRFSYDVTVQEIISVMKNNFAKKTIGLKISSDNLILASIVEREARNDSERGKIASVYLNRLNVPMRLQADPTIQYAKGDWDPITKSDYSNYFSPYNTYLNDGLPPTPICNPGLKSIKAVLNPEKNNYLFFFHNTLGETIFSRTYEEHLRKLQGR